MKICKQNCCEISEVMHMCRDFETYREYYENNLIVHCSQTLAGLKSASLFTVKYENPEELKIEIERMNRLCIGKDLKCKLLKVGAHRCLVYVYREKMLQKTLGKSEIRRFLQGYGYSEGTVETQINHLAERILDEETFPHEIGVFLDYPFEDVLGFIEHTGQDCLLCGYWKVYQNEARAKSIFDLYDACKEKYIRLFLEGTSLEQLVVAM